MSIYLGICGAAIVVFFIALAASSASSSHEPKRDDFATLLQWERDGIFPRIYGGGFGAPEWYEAEKKRRGIVISPAHVVTPQEFNDSEYRRLHNR